MMDETTKAATAAKLLASIGYDEQKVTAVIDGIHGIAENRDLLTPSELCRALKISATTLWRLRPPCVKIGSRKRYELNTVIKHIAQKEA